MSTLGVGPLAETPILVTGGRAPVFTGPFRWLVLANGFGGLAFWGFFGTVYAEAAFRFDAGTSDMAVLGASLSLPFILGSLVQGLVVDRWSAKWLSFLGYLAVLASIVVAWNAASLGWLFASSFLVGAAFATIEPSRSVLTGLLVPPGSLVRANGAMSVSFQLSLLVGTLGGGALLQFREADTVYAASAAAALVPLVLVAVLPDVRQQGERPAMSIGDLRDGGRVAWHDRELRVLLLTTAGGWTLVNVFFVLEPLFVKQVLNGGGDALLYLWGAHGAGAFAGALALTRVRRGAGREAVMVTAGIAAVGLGMLTYVGVGRYPVALAAACVQGVGFALFFPPLLALIQRVVPEEQRGRVTSVFVALQESMGLLSSLSILVLGSLIVVRPTLIGTSTMLVVVGLAGLRSVLRLHAGRERASA